MGDLGLSLFSGQGRAWKTYDDAMISGYHYYVASGANIYLCFSEDGVEIRLGSCDSTAEKVAECDVSKYSYPLRTCYGWKKNGDEYVYENARVIYISSLSDAMTADNEIKETQHEISTTTIVVLAMLLVAAVLVLTGPFLYRKIKRSKADK